MSQKIEIEQELVQQIYDESSCQLQNKIDEIKVNATELGNHEFYLRQNLKQLTKMDGCLDQMNKEVIRMNDNMYDIEKQQDNILEDIQKVQKEVNCCFNQKNQQEGYYKVQLDQIKKQMIQQQSVEKKLLRIEQSVLQKMKINPENVQTLNEVIAVISYNQSKCVSEIQN